MKINLIIKLIFFTTDTDEFVNDSEFFSKIINYSSVEIPVKFKIILKILSKDILVENGKVIIWTIFIQNAKELSKYLVQNGIESKLLIGKIPQDEREKTIKAFKDPLNSDFNVVIANPFSVAESISLHKGCHNAIYLERDYNCCNFIQSKDRINRVGLDENLNQIFYETNYFHVISNRRSDIHNRVQSKFIRMMEIIEHDIHFFDENMDDERSILINNIVHDYRSR